MEFHFRIFYLFLLSIQCLATGGDASPILSVVPSTTIPLGIGSQSTISTIPGLQQLGLGSTQILTSPTSLHSPYVQLLRQPGVLTQGISQLPFVGQQQQLLLNNGQVTSFVNPGLHGLVNPTSGLGLGLSTVNVNGVQMLVPTAGLNGLQTIPQLGGTSLIQNPLLSQPLISVNPVVRQVAEVQEVETPATLVQVDPMDAALAEMENQGQMHMEKYAWGRSALSNKPKQATSEAVALGQDDKAENLRSYYAQSPIGTVGTVVNSDPGVYAAPTPTRTMQTRNPFVDANGKRKKHFEFYQYFRNLNLDPSQAVVPVAYVTGPYAQGE